MNNGDLLLLLTILIAVVVYIGWRIKKWLFAEQAAASELEIDEEIPVTEAVQLLENQGYEVMTVKRRFPILITVDQETDLESRYYVDHFVRENGSLYAVKLARERKPLLFTGSGVRDRLLIYQLLFPETAGVLYVDVSQGTIQKFHFRIER